ncbi:PIN domain-containing protein [Natribaculum luteum]|uniref:PIN domain-containing protein n=1 Tax=Natribaculum luteum TaxID=1586232 RepID=A0ABD5P6P5_9EURY
MTRYEQFRSGCGRYSQRSPVTRAESGANRKRYETTLLEAYEIGAEKNHDVYDSFILALARSYDADYLLTTDGDFDDLCNGEDVAYVNPVPAEKREKLTRISG